MVLLPERRGQFGEMIELPKLWQGCEVAEDNALMVGGAHSSRVPLLASRRHGLPDAAHTAIGPQPLLPSLRIMLTIGRPETLEK